MNRLTGSEDGYEFRVNLTDLLMQTKRETLLFIERMKDHNYDLEYQEKNLLANLDLSIDELLDVYHKIAVNLDELKNTCE